MATYVYWVFEICGNRASDNMLVTKQYKTKASSGQVAAFHRIAPQILRELNHSKIVKTYMLPCRCPSSV